MDPREAMGAGAISKLQRMSLVSDRANADHRVRTEGAHAYGQDEIEPDDSISCHESQHSQTSKLSFRSSASRSSQRALAIKREIELTAKATMMRKCQEIEARKRDLQRKIEEESWKQEQLEIESMLEAAKAYTQILHEGESSSSVVSVTTDSISRAIINRAKEMDEQASGGKTSQMATLQQEASVTEPTTFQPAYTTQPAAVHPTTFQPAYTTQPAAVHPTTFQPVYTTQPAAVHPTTQMTETVTVATPAKDDPVVALLDKLVDFQRESTLPRTNVDSFDGVDSLKFPTFMKNFKMLVEESTTKPKRRLDLLLKFTQGEAKELIRDCVLIGNAEEAYERALTLLQSTYGHSATIAASFQKKAQSWPYIKSGDAEATRKYAVFIISLCTAKQGNLDLSSSVDGYEFLRTVASKLPTALQQQWIRKVGKCRDEWNRPPNLNDFEKFVSQIARDENDPRIQGLGYQGRTKVRHDGQSTSQKGSGRSAFTTVVNKETKYDKESKSTKPQAKENKAVRWPCLYCGEGTHHGISDCRKFVALTSQEKSDHCKKKGLCFGCLNPGHMKKGCPNPEWAKCVKCPRKHPTALHDNERDKKEKTPETITSGMAKKDGGPLMTIIPVEIKAKVGSQHVKTYAFIDNGCGTVFASQELTDALNVRKTKVKIMVKTITSEEIVETQVVQDTLQVGEINGDIFIDLTEVYIKDSIPISEHDIPTQEDLKKWSHLKSIKLPELESDNNEDICIPRVSVMIGNNVPAATQPLQTITGRLGEPYATKSPLGWLVYGLRGMRNFEDRSTPVYFCVTKANDNLENQLKKYMNMDFVENSNDNTRLPSVEDNKFMKLMEERTQLKNSHYVVPLPFRNETVKMPNNHQQAVMYSHQLHKRLTKDEQLHEEYTNFMEKLITKGYAEPVPPQEVERNDGKCWYVPHHPVRHPQKGTLRVVFNCPASYQDTSLNSILLQGPDLINQLVGILLRWRKEYIAVMADIEAMFHQVQVPPDDRDMLRFLWWPEGDLSRSPEVHRMKVHIFGAVSSPSCANYALRRCASDHEATNEYEPEVTNAIVHDFYVDDFVKSVDNEDKAVKLVMSIKKILAEGGFRLTKWLSNSKVVLAAVPEDDRAKVVRDLQFNNDSVVQRTLGVQWNVQKDQLQFDIAEVNSKATRRNILSVMSSIYDPFGITSPFVLQAKIILQDLCRAKVSWDEDIPEEQKKKWERWLSDMPKLSEVKVDRCFKPVGFGQIVRVELHHFADASEAGYGTVSYLRYVNNAQQVHCAFVLGKARVAPLKHMTIPRLELSAATVAAKMNNFLERVLELRIDSTHYWTDSQTVLRYINNEKARYHTFVANRVSVIRDESLSSQWHYVDTKENPADAASRGLNMKDLLQSQQWINGPEFLWGSELHPPSWQGMSGNNLEKAMKIDPEVKKVAVNKVTVEDISQKLTTSKQDPEQADYTEDAVSKIMQYYSDWTKLTRAVAWWLRIRVYLAMKAKKTLTAKNQAKFSETVTLQEMQEAERSIIRHVQKDRFPTELRLLEVSAREVNPDDGGGEMSKSRDDNSCNQQKQPQKMINKSSTLASLDPEIQDGVLVVGGRLRNASIPQNAKHQMILPKDHHVSTLLIRHIHSRIKHQGCNHVLSELRQKFWILKARAAVKSVIKKCVICKKYQSKAESQKMADLPASRVKPNEPPFSRSGVDYFGPFQVRQGRTTRKRYGVIFTCLNSRAVHIEVAESLDTSSCVDAVRRFVARRGNVREIYSDNGTNLVSTNKELKQSLQELNKEHISHYMHQRNIQWHFNPPSASHQGGIWERQIRTIRKILCAMLNEQHMKSYRNDEQLRTFMCEVERTINSRPLTRMSDEPNDLDVITPNDLLLLNNTVAFPPGVFNKKDLYSRSRWRQMQYMADIFWKRWTKEYLPDLQNRQKWFQPKRNVQIGDIVLIVDDQAPRNSWPMGLVYETHEDKQGLVRSAKIKTKTTVLTRPVTKLCVLLECDN